MDVASGGMEMADRGDLGRLDNDPLLVDCVRSVLHRHGMIDWNVRPGDFWCHVHPADERHRVQGWKLHISATPLSAPLVLAMSAEVFVRHGCPFKFAGTIHRVQELVSRLVDRGGGGKFITAYYEGGDAGLRALAEELHTATEGLPGPGILSDRPYRPGSLVHYRFGAFRGVPTLGNDGSYETMLMAPDGSLVQDHRRAWFSPPPWAPPDPFTQDQAILPNGSNGKNGTTPQPVLLNDRYVVREAIMHHFTGGVFRATDRQSGKTVVIKQARPHTGSDVTGHDVRDLRRYEAEMLRQFESSRMTPHLVGLFEQQGDVFLVQEEISGVTLRRWAAERATADDGEVWGPAPGEVGRIAEGVVDLLALVHDRGFVLRDFKPDNVMVTDDGDLRLIDLELLARPGERVVRAATPGYGAPEQLNAPVIGPAPAPAADLYSLGATLFFLVSGCDPVLAADEPGVRTHKERIRSLLDWLSFGNAAVRRFAALIAALLDEDPARRPGLAAVRAVLAREPENAGRVFPAGDIEISPASGAEAKRAILDAIDHLVSTMEPGNPERLWPAEGVAAASDPFNVQHGAAGVLGVLVRAYAAESDPGLRDAVATAAGWISDHVDREPRALPGLYFGRSGTAWALLDAGEALGDEHLVRHAVDLARRVPVRWPNPDVCHGMAGAGLTQLRFWEVTGDDDFLDRAAQVAGAAAAAAERREGLLVWPIPSGFASALAGLVHYGFAHGVAGIGAFLLAAGRATGESRYLDLATSAADSLLSVAEEEHGAAYWPSGETGSPGMTHWCSGSSGVGTFLVRLWQQNGDPRLRTIVGQAAVAVRRSRRHAGPTQCHGLAGDAEFLLDVAEVFQDDRFRGWADELAAGIYARHTLRDGRMVIPGETGTTVPAGFSTGLAGVLAFLLRVRDGGPRLWLPETLTRLGVPAKQYVEICPQE